MPDLATLKKNLEARARIMAGVREFFSGRGFLEVEVPLRVREILPEAHIDAVASEDYFLHPSPEALMKRLAARGFGKIFTMARVFRKGERGDRHLPEFSLLEWYETGADYRALMRTCEGLLTHLAGALGLGDRIPYQGEEILLGPPFHRMTVNEAFLRFAGKSAEEALAENTFDEIMALSVEPALPCDRPVFLLDYPAGKGSLARKSPADPSVAERVELYAAGLELANGFSELTDHAEQAARFLTENKIRASQGRKPYPKPEKFLHALKDLPPCAGMALGLDRLTMLLTDSPTIDQITPFPPEAL